MAIPGISKIEALATKYSKPQLAHMAQMGLVAPTDAVMAGMMIDRIMKENMKPPTTTVAQDVMAPGLPQLAGQQPPQPPAAAPQQPEQAPQMGMPPQEAPQAPEQMAATGGLASLPSGDTGNYAGGGIVAFASGGSPYEVTTPTFQRQAIPIEATAESELARQNELAQAFGINPDFYKERGQEVAAEREKLGKEKSNAWMDALIMGGLGAAAGKSPYLLQNIAEGGVKGFETYQGEMKDIRERDKALRESEMKIKEAEYLRSIGRMDAADKAIMDSKKLKREAEVANVGIANEESKASATAKNEAAKTGFTESEHTKRTNAQIASAEKIAGMDPAELRFVKSLNADQVKKALAEGKPAPTLTDTYNAMQEAKTKPYREAAEYQKYVNQWNTMGLVKQQQYMAEHPEIKTPEAYAEAMMKAAEPYRAPVVGVPRVGGGGGGGAGTATGVDRNNPLLSH